MPNILYFIFSLIMIISLNLALTKAYKALESAESYRKCQEVVQEAKERVTQMVLRPLLLTLVKVADKRIRSKGNTIEEDDPSKVRIGL